MATIQIGGSAVTASSTKNDGGTIVNGGTPVSDSPITKNLNPNELFTGNDSGSKVVAKDGTGAATTNPDGIQVVKSGGAGLAYNVDPRAASGSNRNFIIRAAGDDASKVNNTTNANLNAAQNGVGDGPVKVIATRQHGSASDVAYDVLAVPSTQRVPGRTKGTGAGNASTFAAPDSGGNASLTDASITPTRAVPGELTYHFGGVAKPTTDEYKAKDSFEDATDTSS